MRLRAIVQSLLGVVGTVLLTGCSSAGEATRSAPSVAAAEKGGQEEFGHYVPVEGWPQWFTDQEHQEWTWGSVGAVYAESPDRIWIAQRGELPLPGGAEPGTPYGMIAGVGNATGNTDGLGPTCGPTAIRGWERRWHHVIFVVDREGRLVDQWPQHDALFGALPCGRGPHKIKISPYDADRHVWVIDDQLHVIHKFSYDGELLKTIGELGVPGRGPNNFARPTDIAWLPDGTYFISDGYDGTRVAKFDSQDNFLMDWGNPPVDPENPGPNEWSNVHAIAVGSDRRVYVADRNHGRIQVFDENGNFEEMWPVRRPLELLMTADDHLWVSDLDTARILKYNLEGEYLYGWGFRNPSNPLGSFDCAHGMTVDQESNFYVADCFTGRVQKFEPKSGADPQKLVGQEVRIGSD